MRKLKHLPLEHWPAADHDALNVAYQPGDIFDESRGPGAHHSEGWRRMIRTTYRSERHYNLARSVEASRRFAAHLSKLRGRLLPISTKHED